MPYLKSARKFEPWWKEASERAVRNGFRVAVFGNTLKNKYTGRFKDDMKHGKGVQYYENDTVYEGDWAFDKRHGHGVFSYNCGHGSHSRIYTGMWENDYPHGLGMRQYNDGCIYKGNFDQGYRHGFGCMYYPGGTIYMGRWKKDERAGVGRLISPNSKNYYEGMFNKGMKSGRGRYYHVQHGQVQDGVWENDLCKVSTMWDDEEIRKAAKEKTPYPIPFLLLDDPERIFAEAAKPIYNRTKSCTKEISNDDMECPEPKPKTEKHY